MGKLFKELSKKQVPETEKDILKKWKEEDILNKTIDNRKDAKNFVFYDGPIYANAKPGIHHVFAKTIKDAFCKYKRNYDRRKGNISGVVAAPVANEKTPPPGSEADILNKKQQVIRQKTSVSSTTSVNRNTKGKVIYKIQFLTSNKKLPANSRLFKGYKNVDFYVEKGIYKYTYGETTDFNSIRKMRRTIAKDFKDAFIIAFKDGKKVKY